MKKVLSLAILAQIVSLPTFAQNGWDLQKCIDYAIEHNITIKQTANNVEQGKIALNTSKNNRLPSLTGSISDGVNFGRGAGYDNVYVNNTTNSLGFNLGASVELFTGGRTENEIKAKKLDLEASLAGLSKAKESIALRVISAYLEAINQNDLVEVAERQVELSEAQVHRMQLRYDNNLASGSDLAQIKANKANDETQLVQQKNTAQLALLDLSQLLELPSPEGLNITKPTDIDAKSIVLPSPELVYSEALSIKPQIQQEQLTLKSKEKSVAIARAGYYPTLSLSGGLGSSYFTSSNAKMNGFKKQMSDNFSQNINLNLSIPIFNRFQTRNNIRSAKIGILNQELQLEQTKKDLYKEIQQAYYNALAAQRVCVSTEAALEASKESFALMKNKYENGKANTTEFQEEKTKLMKAEATAIQSKYKFIFTNKILEFYRKTI